MSTGQRTPEETRRLADRAAATPPTLAWPRLERAALHGLAGQIVSTIAAKSEADPAAILIHVLVATGALVGDRPHALVERSRHPARLFAAIVGKSSKARKGTAWSTLNAMCRNLDPDWPTLLASGMSSGEGLIFCVRDAVEKPGKNGAIVTVDAGVLDKRLLIVESELGGALGRMQREGNSLSAVLRDAWDHGALRTMTKQSPLRASNAHVCIAGHITEADLREYLTTTEMANGFGNRFLFVCAQRTQLLPHGAGADDLVLAPLGVALRRVLAHAQTVGVMARDAATARRWEQVYPELSRERDGLVGALLARAEAHALRLSVLYALLDQSAVIQPPHLEAALAVVRYAEASVLYLFSGRLGHPIADTILEALRLRGSMTRTEISELFGRHQGTRQIEEALGMLERANLAHHAQTPTGGRPTETWELVT